MRILLAIMSIGGVLLGLYLFADSFQHARQPGGGIIFAVQAAQGVALIAAGIGFAWMAAVLQELQGIRKALREGALQAPREISREPSRFTSR